MTPDRDPFQTGLPLLQAMAGGSSTETSTPAAPTDLTEHYTMVMVENHLSAILQRLDYIEKCLARIMPLVEKAEKLTTSPFLHKPTFGRKTPPQA